MILLNSNICRKIIIGLYSFEIIVTILVKQDTCEQEERSNLTKCGMSVLGCEDAELLRQRGMYEFVSVDLAGIFWG